MSDLLCLGLTLGLHCVAHFSSCVIGTSDLLQTHNRTRPQGSNKIVICTNEYNLRACDVSDCCCCDPDFLRRQASSEVHSLRRENEELKEELLHMRALLPVAVPGNCPADQQSQTARKQPGQEPMDMRRLHLLKMRQAQLERQLRLTHAELQVQCC